MKKRLLALILCLVMVIGLVPTAFAGSEESSEPVDELNLVFIPDNGGRNQTFWRLAENFHFKQGAVSNSADAVQASDMIAPEGKHFVGWSKTQGVKTDIFEFGTDKYPNQVTLKLYGIWEEDDTPVKKYYYVQLINASAATDAPVSNKVELGQGITLPGDTFTRNGYTLVGWSHFADATKESPDFWAVGARFAVATAAEDQVERLYAIWEKNTVVAKDIKVFYHRMNGSQEFTVETHKDNERFQLEAYTDLADATHRWTLPEGKKVDYWQDANGNKYRVGTWITVGAVTKDEFHLYPVFEDKTTIYKVIYDDFESWQIVEKKFNVNTDITIDPNDGKVSYKLGTNAATQITTKKTIFVTADITLAGVSRTGYKFEGWNYNETTRTFTAVWAKPKYNVTFYCYNHGKTETKEFTYNWVIKIDPNGGTYNGAKWFLLRDDCTIADPTRTGYKFYGWVIDDSVPGTYTFTAVWNNNYYYNSYSIYYYDFDDCKSEYANFPYGTSVVIDPNGGTAKLSGTSFSTKQSFNIYRDYTLTDAARSGYTFYGWDLTKSGSTYYFTAMWSRYKSDVPYMLNGTDHYAYIKGYPNGSFKPTDTITRAEAATIFYRLLTDTTRKAYATTYNSFKDVPATAWYNTAVSTMAKLGIVNGGADGYFRPNDPITRAEIAAMIARCDGAYYTGTSTVFSDTYGHWAAGYIDRAYELGWINGYGTTYAPDRYISRAETVAVLNRVLNRAPQYTSDLTRNYTTFSDVATSAWYYLDVEEAANSHTYTRKSNADYETWTKLIADPSWF